MSNKDLESPQSSPRILIFKLKKRNDIDPNTIVGPFVGYVLLDKESRSIDVYRDQLSLSEPGVKPKDYCVKIGYLQDYDCKTYDFIDNFHNGIALCWGGTYSNFWYSGYTDAVRIALGFDPESINILKKILLLSIINISLELNPDKSSDIYFEILKNHRESESLLEQVDHPRGFSFPHTLFLVNEMSSFLEHKEKWTDLIKLGEDYEELVDRLPAHLKNKTIYRIEKARRKLLS